VYRRAARAGAVNKPFSQACENNKRPILAVLEQHLGGVSSLLEIGSGTGQHAAYFAAHLPHLCWQASDQPRHLPGIRAWQEEAALPNLPPPLELDVDHWPWPVLETQAVFSANTAHIMSWPSVARMIAGAGRVLVPGGWFLLYGPFRYDGQHTSESNADFDRMLRARDPASGVRDAEAVALHADRAGLEIVTDHPMPANNRLLVWRRRP
jgi:SAM-dependent methyltransferase